MNFNRTFSWREPLSLSNTLINETDLRRTIPLSYPIAFSYSCVEDLCDGELFPNSNF